MTPRQIASSIIVIYNFKRTSWETAPEDSSVDLFLKRSVAYSFFFFSIRPLKREFDTLFCLISCLRKIYIWGITFHLIGDTNSSNYLRCVLLGGGMWFSGRFESVLFESRVYVLWREYIQRVHKRSFAAWKFSPIHKSWSETCK